MGKIRLMVFAAAAVCRITMSDACAANYILIANNSNWSNPAAWTTNGTIPGSTDTVFIRNDLSVTIDSDVGSIVAFNLGEVGQAGTLIITNGGKLVTLGIPSTVGRPLDGGATGYANLCGGTLQMGAAAGSTNILNVGVNTATAQATGIFTISGGSFNGRLLVGSAVAGDSGDKVRIEGNGAVIGTASTFGNALEVRASGLLEFVFGTNGISALNYGISGSGGKVDFASGGQIIVDGAAYTGTAKTFTLITAGTLTNTAPAVTLTNFASGTFYSWDASSDLFTVTVSGPSPALPVPEGALLKAASTNDPSKYIFKSSAVLDPNAINSSDPGAAIQAAIDAMMSASSSDGGVIFIKAGTYRLTRPLILRGTGVTIVGVRDVTGTGQWGPYPTLTYGDDFQDPDYNSSSTNLTLQNPAAVRVNGNMDYSNTGNFLYQGIYGLNIEYAGSGGTNQGAMAVGITMHLPHLAMFRDITVTGAYNGLDVVRNQSVFFRNINLLGVRGDFGARCGTTEVSNGLKMHALTVTASNSTARLLVLPTASEVVGAQLSGGRIGIDINGVDSYTRTGDAFLRSVLIENTAEQGVLINYAGKVMAFDMEINNAGKDAIKVLPGFYGGLQISNLRVTDSGYSAIRIQRGYNINIVNAELLSSGRHKAEASADDLPIAGISIDSSVTSLSLVGARIGTPSGEIMNEDWGVYVSTNTPAYPPWHTPTLIVSHCNFLQIPAEQRAFGIPLGSGSYSTLNSAGYFNAPVEDGWAFQGLPTDPVLAGKFAAVKGFNFYDLPELRDRMWIDLTSTNISPAVVDAGGNINSANFTAFLNRTAAIYTNGAVLYLPSGKFSDSAFTNYTGRAYKTAGKLIIDKPGIQLVGDGRHITQIFPDAADQNAIVLTGGSAGSGIFGLSVIYGRSDAVPVGGPGAEQVCLPPFRVENTSHIRLAAIGCMYGLGGGVSIVDTKESELFDTFMSAVGANNTRPAEPLAIYSIEATSPAASSDILMYQAYATPIGNLWISGAYVDWNEGADLLPVPQLPNMDWVRLTGGVCRFRIDYTTYAQGKNGLVTVASAGGTPTDISAVKFATDHTVGYGIDLKQAHNADFTMCWVGARNLSTLIGPDVTGTVRLFNGPGRSSGQEAFSIRGGTDVQIVNGQVGNNCNLWANVAQEDRPLCGIYIGGAVGSARVVGGYCGWAFPANYDSATNNNNAQDWGIILGTGFAVTNYAGYGVDLIGNGDKSAQHPSTPYAYHRGLGLQLNGGTNAVWLSDASAYAMNPADDADADGLPDYWEFPYGSATGLVASADSDGDRFSNLQEYIANTDPADATSVFKMSRFTSGATQKIYFNGSPERLYQLFYTTNGLADAGLVWLPANTNLVRGSGPGSSITVTNTSRQIFYRLYVKLAE